MNLKFQNLSVTEFWIGKYPIELKQLNEFWQHLRHTNLWKAYSDVSYTNWKNEKKWIYWSLSTQWLYKVHEDTIFEGNFGSCWQIYVFPMKTITYYFCFQTPNFFKWANPSLFFIYFRSLQTSNTIFTTNQCEKCPSSLWHRDSNPRPLDQGSLPSQTTLLLIGILLKTGRNNCLGKRSSKFSISHSIKNQDFT